MELQLNPHAGVHCLVYIPYLYYKRGNEIAGAITITDEDLEKITRQWLKYRATYRRRLRFVDPGMS